MIDKIKQLASGFWEVMGMVVLPVFLLALWIWDLLSKNTELKEELKASKGESKLDQLKQEQTTDDNYAAGAVQAWSSFFGRPSNVQDSGTGGNTSATGSDSGPGPGARASAADAADPNKGN